MRRIYEYGELRDATLTEYKPDCWGLAKPIPMYTIRGRLRSMRGCIAAAWVVLSGRAVAVRWH